MGPSKIATQNTGGGTPPHPPEDDMKSVDEIPQGAPLGYFGALFHVVWSYFTVLAAFRRNLPISDADAAGG